MGRRHVAALALFLTISLMASMWALQSGTSQAATVGRSGTPFGGLPDVGALFSGDSDSGTHFCTATVVDSPHHDLLVTAAHCLSGIGAGLVFAPGYHDGTAPHGTWRVVAAYAAADWRDHRDPRADVAFLAVAPRQEVGKSVEVEDVVGGARVTIPDRHSFHATVIGYPLGAGGRPLTCTNRVGDHLGYLSFACGGYVSGTSGGPFLTGSGPAHQALVGVIGGLHQGGCTPEISYSVRFDAATIALLGMASGGGPGDDLPGAGSDGC